MSFEARVWCENGDLLGYAEVTEIDDSGMGFVTFEEVDPDSGYALHDAEFRSLSAAERYAKAWAAGYEEYWQAQCNCGTSDCGIMSLHGILVQYCRDGFDVDD